MAVRQWWRETRLKDPLSAFLFISLVLHAILLAGLGAIRAPKRVGGVTGISLKVRLTPPSPLPEVPQFEMPTFATAEFLQSVPVVVDQVLSDASASAPPDDFSPPPVLALPIEERYFKSSELDEQPRPVQAIQPDYPGHAVAQGIEGWVRLLLLIDERGRVRHIEVVDAQPPGTFDDAAMSAFRLALFIPGKRGSEAVKSRMILKVDFNLDAFTQ